MAYTKTTWTSGSTLLSATNFNKMETGIADAHELVETISNSGMFYKMGKLVTANIYALSASGTLTVPSGYRPRTAISITVIWTNGTNLYPGYLLIGTDGSVSKKFINSNHNQSEPQSGYSAYGNASWFTT